MADTDANGQSDAVNDAQEDAVPEVDAEIEEMKRRVQEMEEEAAKLSEMQNQVRAYALTFTSFHLTPPCARLKNRWQRQLLRQVRSKRTTNQFLSGR
jgi:predicted nuclease with TOPRIM domain